MYSIEICNSKENNFVFETYNQNIFKNQQTNNIIILRNVKINLQKRVNKNEKNKNFSNIINVGVVNFMWQESNNKDKGFDLKNSGGTNQKVDEVEKYNSYIGVYNKLVSFEKTTNSYFKGAGTEAQFKKNRRKCKYEFLQC